MRTKKNYSVLVVSNPFNPKGCFEVLYSYNGTHYSSVDGNTPNHFKECGLTNSCRFETKPWEFYHLMSMSLAQKLSTLDLHMTYKQKRGLLKMLHELSERCVEASCKYPLEIDIPEIVITMANTKI